MKMKTNKQKQNKTSPVSFLLPSHVLFFFTSNSHKFLAICISPKILLKFLHIQLFHIFQNQYLQVSILWYLFMASPSFLKLSSTWFQGRNSAVFLPPPYLSAFLPVFYIAPFSFTNVNGLKFCPSVLLLRLYCYLG